MFVKGEFHSPALSFPPISQKSSTLGSALSTLEDSQICVGYIPLEYILINVATSVEVFAGLQQNHA